MTRRVAFALGRAIAEGAVFIFTLGVILLALYVVAP